MSPVYRDHDFALDQGDLIEDVPFLVRPGPGRVAVREVLGLVTAHGCTCEKFTRAQERDEPDEQFLETYTVHAAPISAASRFSDSLLGDIRSGRVRQFFSIPPERGIPELVVDLALEQPVPARALVAQARRASLSKECWLKFIVHRFVFQSRLKPEDVFREDVLP